MHAKVRVVKGDGSAIHAGAQTSFISNFLNSFSKVVVSINDVEVYRCLNFGFVTYLKTALMQSAEEHKRRNGTEKLFMDVETYEVVLANSGVLLYNSGISLGGDMVNIFFANTHGVHAPSFLTFSCLFEASSRALSWHSL